MSWSHDSVHFAYVLHSGAGSSLWMASIEDAAAPTLVTDALCAILWRGFGWTSQGDGLWYTRAIPMAESASDAGLPLGPITSESAGELSPLRRRNARSP